MVLRGIMKFIDRLAKEYARSEHLIYSDRNIAESAFKKGCQDILQELINRVPHEMLESVIEQVLKMEYSEEEDGQD
jgi:hypothetical protein